MDSGCLFGSDRADPNRQIRFDRERLPPRLFWRDATAAGTCCIWSWRWAHPALVFVFLSRHGVLSCKVQAVPVETNTATKSYAMNTASPIEPASNPKVEHNTRAFLKMLNSAEGPPLEELSPKEARDAFVNLQTSAPQDLPPANIEHKTVEQDGLTVDLTIVRPIGVKEAGPAFLFFHGGGFIVGDFPTHERFVRDLASDSGFTSIFVNYSRSPEAKYPTAINEAYAATRWQRMGTRSTWTGNAWP